MTKSRTASFAPGIGYDRVAESYDNWHWQPFWTRNELPIIESMLRAMPQPPFALDIGTGTGRYSALLRTLGARLVVGLDVSRGMLTVAKRKMPSIPLVQADVRAMPFVSESVTAAIAARSLCHVRELDRAIHEIARLLSRGGTLIVTEVHADHDFEATRLPTANGEVSIATWKRTEAEMAAAAGCAGLIPTHVRRVRATDCIWLPPANELSSLDRTGNRAVFFVASFLKP